VKDGNPFLIRSESVGFPLSREPSHNVGELFGGIAHLLIRHFGEERHAQDSLAGTLGMRETAGSKSEPNEGGL